jgi:hypothetical protein
MGIEMLFQVADKLLRVETSRLTSCILNWRLCEDINHQLNNLDEQTFSLLLIAFQDLVLVVEGE